MQTYNTLGTIQASHFEATRQSLQRMLRANLEDLQEAGLTPTQGDARCLLFGHMTRLAVWQLRTSWRGDIAVMDRLAQVRARLQQIHPLDFVDRLAAEVVASLSGVDLLASMRVKEKQNSYVEHTDLKRFRSANDQEALGGSP